jgi:hypothetical protein
VSEYYDQIKSCMDMGRRLHADYLRNTALTLLTGGIHLIPSDDLKDNQFIVSRGIYEAAKRAGGPRSE